jgi:hypothetical protein
VQEGKENVAVGTHGTIPLTGVGGEARFGFKIGDQAIYAYFAM